jgi:hypothetical protein
MPERIWEKGSIISIKSQRTVFTAHPSGTVRLSVISGSGTNLSGLHMNQGEKSDFSHTPSAESGFHNIKRAMALEETALQSAGEHAGSQEATWIRAGAGRCYVRLAGMGALRVHWLEHIKKGGNLSVPALIST